MIPPSERVWKAFVLHGTAMAFMMVIRTGGIKRPSSPPYFKNLPPPLSNVADSFLKVDEPFKGILIPLDSLIF